ncbi:hypothetical protein AbraIFM66951_003625 [Aspergillus brasiliensis]|uniref:Epoxide hydrolase N-terminal domain-containing protein n=1 Tax=Aspergillus brasiliensis TaxID=319629 RepID=A0A9W6DT32_9EURO|nr:hypothetical protein AbraCBS73388_002568 [Aspergillus brasiliensis]GKZ50488.1 hypothetical protein AbraIFM66951_003625 [Aspergillus brasiliensis]
MSSIQIDPLVIDVPEAEVARLKRKLVDTRLPEHEMVPGAGDVYGTKHMHMSRRPQLDRSVPTDNFARDRPPSGFKGYTTKWAYNYDCEYDVTIHFTYTTSMRKDAIPIILIHGWPGSFYEFDRLVDNLRVTGHQYPRCRAVHLSLSPATEDFIPESDSEKKKYERSQDWLDNHPGYAVCMRTRPHTLGCSLHDNPMGVLSWVGEKYYELVSPARRTDPAWDQIILTQISLYYFSGCIMSSMLPYYVNPKHAEFAKLFMMNENRVKVPMAYTPFLYHSQPGNERSAKLTGNLLFYDGMSIVLHFCEDVITNQIQRI